MANHIERDKEADLEKLSKAFFANLRIDNCDFGGIGLDSKRPFGYSHGILDDILNIIGWKPEGDKPEGEDRCYSSHQEDYAEKLYHQHLIPYLRKRFG